MPSLSSVPPLDPEFTHRMEESEDRVFILPPWLLGCSGLVVLFHGGNGSYWVGLSKKGLSPGSPKRGPLTPFKCVSEMEWELGKRPGGNSWFFARDLRYCIIFFFFCYYPGDLHSSSLQPCTTVCFFLRD